MKCFVGPSAYSDDEDDFISLKTSQSIANNNGKDLKDPKNTDEELKQREIEVQQVEKEMLVIKSKYPKGTSPKVFSSEHQKTLVILGKKRKTLMSNISLRENLQVQKQMVPIILENSRLASETHEGIKQTVKIMSKQIGSLSVEEIDETSGVFEDLIEKSNEIVGATTHITIADLDSLDDLMEELPEHLEKAPEIYVETPEIYVETPEKLVFQTNVTPPTSTNINGAHIPTVDIRKIPTPVTPSSQSKKKGVIEYVL